MLDLVLDLGLDLGLLLDLVLGLDLETHYGTVRAMRKPEKFLRYLALNDRPIVEYGLDEAGTQEKSSPPPLFRNRNGSWVAA